MKERNKISPRTIGKWGDFSTTIPALILVVMFTYVPIVNLVKISFTNWNLLNDGYKFVGLKNWTWLFKGSGTKYLLNSLRVTMLFSLGEILITLVGGFLLALVFNKLSKGFSAMRAIVFMPKYIAMSSAAVIYLWMFNTDSGIFNFFLSKMGLPIVDWLGQRNTALISILLLTGWRDIGYGMIIYLSAIQGISKSYYEAADISGATYWQKLRYITIPMLSPTTLFLFVTTFLASMKVFQSVDILTAGGPYRSTEVFVYQIYQYAMEDFRMDRASAMALAFFVLLLIVTIFTMKISNRKVNYDS